MTPWQTIHPSYVPVFFLVTLLLGMLLVFSKLPSRLLLGLVVLYSFLLASYLPLTHELFYGADGWRHLASEQALLAGHWPTKPILAGGERDGFGVGDVSYGLFWFLSVAVSKVLVVNLLAVMRWLQPVLFAMLFPLLLWRLTGYLAFAQRGRFFALWLAHLPFALQAVSSFSLPVNLGFLVFLGGLVLLAAHARGQPWASRPVLALYAVVLAVNYLLFLLLYLLIWALVQWFNFFGSRPRPQQWIGLVVAGLALAGAIPLVELVFGYSQVEKVFLVQSIRQFVGNLLGWYTAFGPPPHDIVTGNILFNQPPLPAWVPIFLTARRLWLPILALVFWASAAVGVVVSLRAWLARGSDEAKKNMLGRGVFGLLTAGLFGSYFLGRYVLTGEQILSRRLEGVLALLAVLAIAFLCEWRLEPPSSRRLILWLAVIVVGALGISASYSLGPDARAVSSDEYRAMEYVWEGEQREKFHCVLADTHPLLVLEALSGRQIVGGGFPIDRNFAQPERVALFERLQSFPEPLVWQTARQLTGAKQCWFVGAGGHLNEWLLFRTGLLTPDNIKKFGKITVWRYTTP